MCAGVGSGGTGGFRCVLVCAGVGSGGRFRKVPVCAGAGSGKVPEGSGLCWCRFRKVPEGSGVCAGVGCGCNFRKVPEGSGECGLLSCSLDRSSHMIVFEHLLVITVSALAKPLRNKNAPM